jgi:hypothetical protein
LSEQSSSDPLPYVQVDRAVRLKAGTLAGLIGSSPQHAIGTLVEWWDLSGDPRELERIIRETPPGHEPAVVLSAEQAASRFRIACGGKAIDAEALVELGLLEDLGEGRVRVRGMSRYFEPVKARLRARTAAVAGGLASVEARKRKLGSAQPPGGKGTAEWAKRHSDSGSNPFGSETEAQPKQQPKQNRTDDRSTAEAYPKPSGQRSAVNDLLPPSEVGAARAPAQAPTPTEPPKPRQPSRNEAFHAWALEDRNRQRPGLTSDEPLNPRTLNSILKPILDEVGRNGAERSFRGYLAEVKWRDKAPPWPFRLWCTVWRQYVTAEAVDKRASTLEEVKGLYAHG